MPFKSTHNPPVKPSLSDPDHRLRIGEVFAATIDLMDIAMWELDLNYRVLSTNRKAREIYGEEAIGDFCFHAAAGLDKICSRCPAEAVYQGEPSGRSEHKRTDVAGNDIYIDHIATPIKDRNGNLSGVMVLIIDITRHKRMEEELKQHRDHLEEVVAERTRELTESETRYRKLYKASKRSEELYRSLLHSSADAIVVYDPEGNATYVSPTFTQIFGWTFEELKGKRIPFLPESEREASMGIIRDLLEKGTPCHGFETRRYTKDGDLIDISLSASRFHDHEGNTAGMLVILRDISKNKKLEAQLKHSERMEAIGILAGGVAHDFNNLLMGMMGNVSLMLHEMAPEHRFHDRLQQIEKLIQSGARLTSQLLGYARKGRYHVKSVDVNRIIRNTVETFIRTRRDIAPHLDLAEDLPTVEADETQMEQIFLNLFINAADSMPEGGSLIVSTQATGGQAGDPQIGRPRFGTDAQFRGASPETGMEGFVMIRVSDTGTGIDSKIIDHVFDPFFTTKEVGRGTGLGLASVYGIVKSHGGHIMVDSEAGTGTTFRVYLPGSEKSVLGTAPKPVELASGSGTVLLVDDEEMVLDVGARMIQRMGYSVIPAGSGAEAIRIFRENPGAVDLVVLDMVLPGLGGGEIFDVLQEIDPNVRVLISTGYSLQGQAREILERGCRGFIQKPFSMEELSEKIRDVLS